MHHMYNVSYEEVDLSHINHSIMVKMSVNNGRLR